MCELAPQYTTFTLNKRKIGPNDYGKTLGELGFKNHDIVTVKKKEVVDTSTPFPLCNPEKTALSERGSAIFNIWFDMFSEQPERVVMTPESTTWFIKGATGEEVAPNENRITGLFDAHDKDKDGKL